MIDAALLDVFSVPELTHPVTLGASSTRGYLDSAGEMAPLAGTEVQFVGTVLYVRKGSLPGLEQGATVQVGPLGAVAVGATPTVYRINVVRPIEDGRILACECGGGR